MVIAVAVFKHALVVVFFVFVMMVLTDYLNGMISTSGDEAFVMLAMFPEKALFLFGVLFLLAIASGWLIDGVAVALRINPSQECQLQQVHADDEANCRCWASRPPCLPPITCSV